MDEAGAQAGMHEGPPDGVAAGAPEPLAGGGRAIDELPFDRTLDELRTVVSRLEDGGLPLEESIALYERGVALHDHCARLLAAAELRVQRLVDASGGAPRALDLRPDDEADE